MFVFTNQARPCDFLVVTPVLCQECPLPHPIFLWQFPVGNSMVYGLSVSTPPGEVRQVLEASKDCGNSLN